MWLALAAVIWCALVAAGLAFAPLPAAIEASAGAEVTASASAMSSGIERKVSTRTWAQQAGWGSVAVIAGVPMLVSAAAALSVWMKIRAPAIIAAVAMWIWIVIGTMSFGIFYVPAGLLLVAVAGLSAGDKTDRREAD